ncbi:tetratricopeptide repeat-containing sensor histidine kinase [Runella slithyformis]|uniref:histidine kinase n=1 Tax=Runella slithyformis (strain ATCC 29530 / DSM 19594 / LMG 11500 / NCIMB 11436 / LSU 4) TaxID=761193 RepID=A0A7U4E460_RUNSL|nr:ATP-binding protein [Runella slithyformis]AEI46724.1 ATP-binding region ATPase domain protein [Runella slithyformis DSM 19594]
MKKWSTVCFLFLFLNTSFSQPTVSPLLADSLKRELTQAKEDTNKVLLLVRLTQCYTSLNTDIALQYARLGKDLANRLDYAQGKIRCAIAEGFILAHTNEYVSGLAVLIEAQRFSDKFGTPSEKAAILANIAYIYAMNKDYVKAKHYLNEVNLVQKIPPVSDIQLTLGIIYKEMNRLETAIFYLRRAYTIGLNNQLPTYLISSAYFLGTAYAASGKTDSAVAYYRKSIEWAELFNIRHAGARAYQGLAQICKNNNQLDSAVIYSQKALNENGNHAYRWSTVIEASTLLSQVYEQKNDLRAAFHYFKLAMAAKDSLGIQEKNSQIRKLAYEEHEREIRTKRRIEANKEAFQNQLKIYALSGLLGGLVLLAFLLYRNNRQKQKANTLLHRQKEEIIHQRQKAEKALSELKSMQAQLVQSEKLASLGELTAGIAHEIQNPLNFVTNFSELSIELAKELKEERLKLKEDRDEELENELVDDLIQNQEKINHHGKRASSIVKGMLEHSRTGTGERQLTDINQLADEYLRLSYHGLRAKDSKFNSAYEFISDENLPEMNVVPQDMGRVLLNLINNSFYAVQEQSKRKTKQGISDYKPTVIVRTKAEKDQIIITVTDNGTGMPEEVQSKIFQPFFTTKPAGEGTGLGLSLAYDIVTKGHSGTLEVESKEDEGTTFTLKLPIL